MLVIIDSMEFARDPYARKKTWDRLREWTYCELARVVVPRIVIDEAVTHFRTILREEGASIDRSLKRICKLLPEGEWNFRSIPLDESETQYRVALAARLDELDIDHRDEQIIVQESNGSRSVKVAMICGAITRFLGTAEESIVVITENVRDFGSPAALASDLIAELERCGVASNRVRIFRSLYAFVKSHVRARLKEFDRLAGYLDSDSHPNFNLAALFTENFAQVREALREYVEHCGEYPNHFNTATFGSPELTVLSGVPEQAVLDASQMENDSVALFLAYRADGIVTCWSRGEQCSGVDIQFRVTFEIQASVVIHPQSGKVEDFEIGDLGYRIWNEDLQSDDGQNKDHR